MKLQKKYTQLCSEEFTCDTLPTTPLAIKETKKRKTRTPKSDKRPKSGAITQEYQAFLAFAVDFLAQELLVHRVQNFQ